MHAGVACVRKGDAGPLYRVAEGYLDAAVGLQACDGRGHEVLALGHLPVVRQPARADLEGHRELLFLHVLPQLRQQLVCIEPPARAWRWGAAQVRIDSRSVSKLGTALKEAGRFSRNLESSRQPDCW
jgi:hypothetical protein